MTTMMWAHSNESLDFFDDVIIIDSSARAGHPIFVIINGISMVWE
jgi:hypothetical protein